MVKTIQINTPIKLYGPNFITSLCSFVGDEENRSALYDNSAEKVATFYILQAGQPKEWKVSFADKYGQDVIRTIDTVIIQNCTADSVEILYKNEQDTNISLGKFYLETNNIFTVAKCQAKGLVFRFFCKEESFVIGEIRALKYLFDLKATSNTAIEPNTSGGSYTSQDGSFYGWNDYHVPGLIIDVANGDYEQYKILRGMIQNNENVTVIPFVELDFFVTEGVPNGDLKPSINRFSGLVDYSIKVVSV